MGHESHGTDGWGTEERDGLHPLGPPGWEEFQAARRRFETSMARLGAEAAASRPVPAGGVLTERDLVRVWR
jgi:hypothetical protein